MPELRLSDAGAKPSRQASAAHIESHKQNSGLKKVFTATVSVL